MPNSPQSRSRKPTFLDSLRDLLDRLLEAPRGPNAAPAPVPVPVHQPRPVRIPRDRR